MLTLSFTFPAGRYHATPWGRHVNEADVGWPPDLWRLCRAFIATWHRKLDHGCFPRPVLDSLLTTLAAEPPRYALPDAVHFHTRHFMPAPEKRTLIFDAFAQVARDAPLIVHWPGVCLDGVQTALLDALLGAIGFLGRAESWTDARRLEDWSGECDCFPSELAMDPETGEIADLIPLWLPRDPVDYTGFRAHTLQALSQRSASAKELKSVRATLPEDWLDALSIDTGELQAAGWSAPPAGRQVYYRRAKNVLRFMAAAPARHRHESSGLVTTARYALYAKPLPRFTDAVRVGETLRMALMGRARRLFGDAIPACLSGHDLPNGNRHGHAFFLPEKNMEGRIDHLLVHAPDGFDAQARAALAELKSIHTNEGGEWRLILEGLGELETFPAAQPLRQSTIWLSVSPYLHPWHTKKGFGVPEQVARECRLRGLPEPVAVGVMPDAKPRALDFRRFRSKRGLRQPDRQGCFLKLTFDVPVRGPMALGFGCHYGLGLFAPV